MGFFGKLFGKKEKDFDFTPPKDSDLGLGPDLGDNTAGLGGTPDLGTTPDVKAQQPLPTLEPVPEQSFQQPPPAPQPNLQPQDPTYVISKNLEVISSKLDALQATIESLNQRLINLENIARGEQERSKYKW